MGADVSVIVALLLLLQASTTRSMRALVGSTRLPWRERCDAWTGYWSPGGQVLILCDLVGAPS
jgi:hypothetical protein